MIESSHTLHDQILIFELMVHKNGSKPVVLRLAKVAFHLSQSEQRRFSNSQLRDQATKHDFDRDNFPALYITSLSD